MEFIDKLGEVCDYVDNLDDKKLITLCNDIYDWRYVKGNISENSTIAELAKDLDFPRTRELESIIMGCAHRKFDKLVLLLIKDCPNYYFK